jgi:hypothetical protein
LVLDAGVDRSGATAGLTDAGGSVTVVVVNTVPRQAAPPPDAGCDTRLVFSVDRLVLGQFPAVDPVESQARFAPPTEAAAALRALVTA